MALAAGTRLGPYEIVAALGAGGMGEVYQARDTRLDRTVAIKVLPTELSTDPERRARFEREARTIAALNHPHICTLHDIGQHDGTTYLVMEHLAGETLAQRLRKGALPVPQALEIGAQIAEALDAAHTQGIVHRDLKPSNVMLTASAAGRSGLGTVKLLDFGLAKLRETAAHPTANASEPTGTEPLTQAGEVLGTRPYMAPEQVEGKATDARTDLWALSCVLYEMVTGRPAFTGDSVASITAAILTQEPEPLTTRQPLTPPALDHVVRKCFAKAPEDRWASAHDVADELRWISTAGTPVAASPGDGRAWSHRGMGVIAAALGLLGLAVGVGVTWQLRPGTAPVALAQLSLDVRPADELNAGGARPVHLVTPGGSRTALAWTPDGQALVFVGREGTGQRLYVRRLDAPEARPLANTEGAQMPAVSADGQWVAFWADGAIRKVPIAGGPVTTLAANARISSGLSWDSKGGVFFDDGARRILRIPPDGPPADVTKAGAGEVFHMLPHPLPRDGVLLFTVRRTHWSWGREEVVALNLATGERKTVLLDATDARFVPTGHLVFMRRGQLLAVAFDPERLAVHGRPEALLDGVAQSLTSGNLADNVGAGQFAVAPNGTLAWLPGAVTPYPTGKLVAVSRHGRVTALPAPERSYVGGVRSSLDGRRLIVGIRSLTDVGLWVLDLDRGTLNPITRDGEAMWSVWSPDGATVLFTVLKDGEWFVARQAVDLAAPARTLAKGEFIVSSLASDGRHLAVAPRRPGDITVLALETAGALAQPFLQTGDLQSEPVFSPDGRWLAYTSNASGQSEPDVYVRPYPGPGPPLQVSAGGGWCSIWHPDGRELFYVTGKEHGNTGSMMAVAFTAETAPRVGTARRLFDFDRRRLDLSTVPIRAFDISRDAQQFYTVEYEEAAPPPVVTHINLVQNWVEELKAKVPSGTR